MKRGLVFAGGGSKGSYEAGFVKALREQNLTFDIVTGTSVGALNGCLFAQEDYEKIEQLWMTVSASDIFADIPPSVKNFNYEILVNDTNLVVDFFKNYLKEKGADIAPFRKLVKSYLDVDKLMASPIDFGLCTVRYPSLKPLFITKEQMPKNQVSDYLIASASCFPVFPICHFNGESFIDGGYYDNVPVDLALEMGATELIIIDLNTKPTHRYYADRPKMIYSISYSDLGTFMDFSRQRLNRNYILGYLTAKKVFEEYLGKKYTFETIPVQLMNSFYYIELDCERMMRRALGNNQTSPLYERYLEANHGISLKITDYYCFTLDWLGDILLWDETHVYQFEEVVSIIEQNFTLAQIGRASCRERVYVLV